MSSSSLLEGEEGPTGRPLPPSSRVSVPLQVQAAQGERGGEAAHHTIDAAGEAAHDSAHSARDPAHDAAHATRDTVHGAGEPARDAAQGRSQRA